MDLEYRDIVQNSNHNIVKRCVSFFLKKRPFNQSFLVQMVRTIFKVSHYVLSQYSKVLCNVETWGQGISLVGLEKNTFFQESWLILIILPRIIWARLLLVTFGGRGRSRCRQGARRTRARGSVTTVVLVQGIRQWEHAIRFIFYSLLIAGRG